MKTLAFIISLILTTGLLSLTGCSKGGGIDTSKVEGAFQLASSVDKAEVEKAISAVNSGDPAGALASLQKAAASIKLTEEQKRSVQDRIDEIQGKVDDAAKQGVDAATKAGKEGADKAAADLQKAIGS